MNSHVLYLALGSYRVLAAHEHVKRLATSGSQVVLAAPDTDEWSDVLSELSRAEGVTVIRLSPDGHGSVQRSAKRLLSGRSGAAAAVDTIVAGDAQAIPTAWRLARSRPEVTLRMEPYDNGDRVPEPADLAVVTPWYPSPNNPYLKRLREDDDPQHRGQLRPGGHPAHGGLVRPRRRSTQRRHQDHDGPSSGAQGARSRPGHGGGTSCSAFPCR